MSNSKSERIAANSHSALSRKFDLLVFIGRFQPMHKGHERVIEIAEEMADNVLVIVGSAGQARSIRNPFTFNERSDIIRNLFPNVAIEPISDSQYSDTKWVTDVQQIVKRHSEDGYKIGLIGMERDHTSYYLKLFPQWESVGVEECVPLSATKVREMVLENELEQWEMTTVDVKTAKFLKEFAKTEPFARLKAEYEFVKQYKKEWGEGPHLTADALVEVGGNILLIKRGKEYGHGLYALPGGFMQKNERFQDAMVRELKEETRLKVPKPVLLGSVVASDVFDRPHRSERGRVITQCYHIRLENETSLPEVRGSDDAEWAGFVQISDLLDGTITEADFFEDHYHIIRSMLGI